MHCEISVSNVGQPGTHSSRKRTKKKDMYNSAGKTEMSTSPCVVLYRVVLYSESFLLWIEENDVKK